MNRVALIGRITKEIDLKSTTSGKSVTNVTLAVPRNETDRDGNKVTDFIRVTAWGKTAELLEKYVRKGDQVGIAGKIRVSKFERDGQIRESVEVVAEDITFIGSKRDEW